MAETAKNFFGSYFSAERLTTVEYPEQRIAPFEAARVFPFLVFDGADWQAGLRCVACQICEKECPPKCIFIEKSKDKKPDALGKPLDTEYELSTSDRFGGLLLDRKQLAKSNQYYRQIHPSEAAGVDAKLAAEKAKAEAKSKAAASAVATKTAAIAGEGA
jgi:NADH-quinone oxidoreductase subunit I